MDQAEQEKLKALFQKHNINSDKFYEELIELIDDIDTKAYLRGVDAESYSASMTYQYNDRS